MADIDNVDQLEELIRQEEEREKALAEIRKRTAALKNDPIYRKKVIDQITAAFDQIGNLCKKINFPEPKTSSDESGMIIYWSIKSDGRQSKRGVATAEQIEKVFDQLPNTFKAQNCNRIARAYHKVTLNCKSALKDLVNAGKLTQNGNEYSKPKGGAPKK